MHIWKSWGYEMSDLIFYTTSEGNVNIEVIYEDKISVVAKNATTVTDSQTYVAIETTLHKCLNELGL